MDGWKDVDIRKACFNWMHEWKAASMHTIVGIQELLINSYYQQSCTWQRKLKRGIPVTTPVECVEKNQRASHTSCWMCCDSAIKVHGET
mgnify:CR=1 FL=1